MNLDMGWVDVAMLAVLCLSMLVGAWRGFVFEVLAIAGWVVAYFVAREAAPMLAPHLPIGTAGSLLNRGSAFALAFIAALLIWGLLSRLVRHLVSATPLAPVDRVLGAGFGLARAGILLVVASVLVSYTPAARSAAWQASWGARWIASAVRAGKPMLPSDVARLLPT